MRELSKSMLAAKSFEATSDVPALVRWLGILADELADRMVTDAEANQRTPRLLVLSYRSPHFNGSRTPLSHSLPAVLMPSRACLTSPFGIGQLPHRLTTMWLTSGGWVVSVHWQQREHVIPCRGGST